MYYQGSLRELEALIKALREDHGLAVLGYKLENGRVVWGELKSAGDLPLGVEDVVKPGFYRLERGWFFRHSYVSPKTYLHPAEQVLAVESRDFDLLETPSSVERRVAFFGVKPCDVHAIRVLDTLLRPRHPVYSARRGSVAVIVVEECMRPNSNCFCAVLGTGPIALNGFDVAYARLGSGEVVFKTGSPLGEKILENLGFEKARGELLSRYSKLVEEAVEKMRYVLPVDTRRLGELLESAGDERLWEKVSERCVGCGNCNYVCPTCFCLELDYVAEWGRASKVAKWTGCLVYSYGLVAGGHFRPKLYMRYRHFILHKFVFYPRQVGLVGCSGCGRCITWCPVGVDIREALKEALRGVQG